MTWILLSQHAQVVDVDDTTLTLGFNNPGAHQSFLGGGNDEIVGQVLIDQIGHAWRIEAIVDPSAQSGQAPPRAPKAAAAHEPTPAPSEAVTSAREAIQESRQASPPATVVPAVSDAEADPDDPDADDQGLAGAELLQRELGASVIEEITHE